MGFTLPQFGIFAQGTHAHHFLEFDLRPGVTPDRGGRLVPEAAHARRLGRWREPGRRVRSRRMARGRAGGGAGVADRVPRGHGARRPPGAGDPARRLDLDQRQRGRRHLRSRTGRRGAVDDVALLAAEQPGFTYHEGRDETGFVDGTANPPVRRAADVALVPPGEPGEAAATSSRCDGCTTSTRSISSRREQERGDRANEGRKHRAVRREKPPTHTSPALRSATDELQIFRRSVPYGTVDEHGLYFVAFSADRSRFDRMLARMFGPRRCARPSDDFSRRSAALTTSRPRTRRCGHWRVRKRSKPGTAALTCDAPRT